MGFESSTGDFAYVYEVPKDDDRPRWSVTFPTFLYRAEWMERLEIPPAPLLHRP